ncbi:MAG: IS630 family transposase, partial [Phycisphaerales bacterium]
GLNMAECELSVLEKQALADRIGDQATLDQRIDAWQADRNHRTRKIDWQFQTADARIKLRHLYPQIQLA